MGDTMDRKTIYKFLTAAARMFYWQGIAKESHEFGDPVLCDNVGIHYLVLWLEGHEKEALAARLEREYKAFQETYRKYFEKYPDGWCVPTQEQNDEMCGITCQAFRVQDLLESVVSILGGKAGKRALDAHHLNIWDPPPWVLMRGTEKAETQWIEVQNALLRKREMKEAYTSQPELAQELNCSPSTINKAIKNSTNLKGWMGS